MSHYFRLLHILLLYYIDTKISAPIDCESVNCNGQTLTCDDPAGCVITCQQCQNTIILCTNDIIVTCAITCLVRTNACVFAEIYSAAQDTTFSCEVDNGCSNSKMFFGDVYDYLPPTVKPTAVPSQWNAPSTATYHVAAHTSFSLENAAILCKGDIQYCIVQSSNTNAVNNMNIACNAPNADCYLHCLVPEGCNNVQFQCIYYQLCSCTNYCGSVTTTYGTVKPTTAQPTAIATTSQPTTNQPTNNPTPTPTNNPTDDPSLTPTNNPTPAPTNNPSKEPTVDPTNIPTHIPTKNPTTNIPTRMPTANPTTVIPTVSPSVPPTVVEGDLIEYKIIIKSEDTDLNENDIGNIVKDSTGVNEIFSTKNTNGSIIILLSVPNNVNLDQDIIKTNVEVALQKEYGNEIDIDVEVERTSSTSFDNTDTEITESKSSSTLIMVLAIVAVILAIVLCALIVLFCKKKKRKDEKIENSKKNCITSTVKIETQMTEMIKVGGDEPQLMNITRESTDDDDEALSLYENNNISTVGEGMNNNEGPLYTKGNTNDTSRHLENGEV